MDNGFEKDSMLECFLFETMEQLTQLEHIALHSETDNCVEKQINEVFRIVHTIKGSSAFMNYENIVALTHSLEDVFYYIRENNPLNVNYSILTDIVLKSIDHIKIIISLIQSDMNPEVDVNELVDEIKNFLSRLKGNVSVQKLEVNENVTFSKKEQTQFNENHFNSVIFFQEGCEMENIRAFAVLHNIEEYVNVISYSPQDIIQNQETSEYIRKNGFKITFSSNLTYEEIEKLLDKTLFIKNIKLEMTQTNKNSKKLSDSIPKDSESNNGNAKQSMISVSINKMDRLMDLVGELVISQAMVIQNPELEGLNLNTFVKASRQLQLVTNEIQDAVMSIRMISLAMTFQRMQRIVRDMSKKLNKEIKLEVIGENTEVDKNIIEHLSDPLLHLVRNAADHGIETPGERIKAGKSSIGTITLEAKNDGGDVRIIVKDDGIGLNKEKIINKAKQLGLLKKPENELSDREIYSLIFLPGFSTTESITQYSGRGVGMDVVNKGIEEIGGAIRIDSCLGKYTSIDIKIPLTLAIIDGMKVRVGKSIYIVPITSIRESFRISDNKIITDEATQSEMIMIRGGCYPVLRLYEYFKITPDVKKLEDGIIIVVENESKMMCLFADELMGEQQVVIKALPDYIKKRRSISSCTVIGNGSVSLIIDIPGLFSSA